jgi:hypothetical protein
VDQDDVYRTPVQFEAAARTGGISLSALVDVSLMEFRRNGGVYERSVPVLFAVFDWDGNLVKSGARRVDVKLKPDALSDLKSRGLPVRSDVEVKPGKYLARVVVISDTDRRVMASVTRAVVCE